MKTHKTIMLTVELLRYYSACDMGLAAALPFLPAKISTDPESNLELADAFVTATDAAAARPYNTANGLAWARWLVNSATTERIQEFWENMVTPKGHYVDTRYLVAQMLAIWADAALTAKGK